MAKIEKFEDLEIWNKSREICFDIEVLFETTNLGKRYSLKDQMDRSSGSIMDNIAEGFERGGNREFINFLSYSKGSSGELKSQLYRALDKKLISQTEFDTIAPKIELVKNKIGAFMKYLNTTDIKGIKFNNKP
ncbi:four helix bundle protein [Flavobacterium sp. SUN052]|uniref:four helix bundle protein n=1 Tax=Flavobacterium sp. SUN052 TaxID=3002441 RepID=UPI00237DBB76|nr:four helix bundle protein [Flavobacterium sp. SUN052]MEC4005812.1 four helix bundle protein [Flavobacterium sp. SUN052]